MAAKWNTWEVESEFLKKATVKREACRNHVSRFYVVIYWRMVGCYGACRLFDMRARSSCNQPARVLVSGWLVLSAMA